MNAHRDISRPSSTSESASVLRCRGRTLHCTRPHPDGAIVMGILNVTPDSFSDGGVYVTVEAALRRARQMLREGARIIDVGGESSRPRGSAYGAGAVSISAADEIARVEPVVRALVAECANAIVSVDTYKPEVVRAVLAAGAHIINDVTSLRYHPETARLAADVGAGLVLMHSIGKPGDMPQEHAYADVVRDVGEALDTSMRIARQAGVSALILDPGFGFGKTVDENFALLARLDRIVERGVPVMIGVSRKNSIGVAASGGPGPLPVHERLFGSLGATAAAVMRGATIVRTHDVRPTVEMLRVLSRAVRESAN